MTAKMAVPRIYTDDAKDSRFDSYEVPLSLYDHAPPAAPFFTGEPEAATNYVFFQLPPGCIVGKGYSVVVMVEWAPHSIFHNHETGNP
jgi:hypothetical protein